MALQTPRPLFRNTPHSASHQRNEVSSDESDVLSHFHQQSSQQHKLPIVRSLHWELPRLTSSAICPFSRRRVTQRVIQNSLPRPFFRCLGRSNQYGNRSHSVPSSGRNKQNCR